MLDARWSQTFESFDDRTLPKSEWTHQAHLVVCRVALSTRTAAETVGYLRSAIRAYNEVTGVENTASSGYHETLTRYFVDAVASLGASDMDDVFASPRCERAAPLRYWSRTRLFSPAARAAWIEPDLAALPWTSEGLLRQSS